MVVWTTTEIGREKLRELEGTRPSECRFIVCRRFFASLGVRLGVSVAAMLALAAGLIWFGWERREQQRIVNALQRKGFLIDNETMYGNEPVLPDFITRRIPRLAGWTRP